jgi:hypothetical protein
MNWALAWRLLCPGYHICRLGVDARSDPLSLQNLELLHRLGVPVPQLRALRRKLAVAPVPLAQPEMAGNRKSVAAELPHNLFSRARGQHSALKKTASNK